MKRLLTLAVASAMALSATSAFAESLADTVKARPSAEASVGLHLSLGGKASAPAKPTYGASLGLRGTGQTVSQSLTTPTTTVAELNFSGGELNAARIGGVNFTTTDHATGSTRLGMSGEMSKKTTWILVIVGVVAAYELLDNGSSYVNCDLHPSNSHCD